MVALSTIAFGLYQLRERGMLPVNEASDDWYEARTAHEVLVDLPHDDAPHDDYMEWWYYNGRLVGEEGNEYSFHYTVFLINALGTHTVAHASFADLTAGRHFSAQKRSTGNPSTGTEDRFDFVLGSWQMTGGDGKDRLRISADDFHFNLILEQSAPPVMQGGTGLLDFELAGKSYYYTRPRMDIRGSVKVDGKVDRVRGVAWFDHQWGNFEVNQLGWDWFAVQLDDGTDIMLYQLFDSGGLQVLHSGTVARQGATQVLTGDDFRVEVLDHWVSDRTGIEYPMGWEVEIPGRALRLELTPVLADSEFDGRLSSYKVYWEGAVNVEGTHTGQGFVEMSGYKATAGRPAPGEDSAAAETSKDPVNADGKEGPGA